MKAIKHLQEDQQALVYKKLCESALRVYDSNSEVKSVEEWKKIYETILEVTKVKVRKTARGLRVTSEIMYEDISLDTNNLFSRDCVARWMNDLDDGSEKGSTVISNICNHILFVRKRYLSKLV